MGRQSKRARTPEYHREYRARKKAEAAAESAGLGLVKSEPSLKAGTAEYYREWRAKKRRQVSWATSSGYDKDDPLYQPRFVEAGRELAEMMNTPALDWPTSKWAKEMST